MLRPELLQDMKKARRLLKELSPEDQRVFFEAEPWLIYAIVHFTHDGQPDQNFDDILQMVKERVPGIQEAWQRLAALPEEE